MEPNTLSPEEFEEIQSILAAGRQLQTQMRNLRDRVQRFVTKIPKSEATKLDLQEFQEGLRYTDALEVIRRQKGKSITVAKQTLAALVQHGYLEKRGKPKSPDTQYWLIRNPLDAVDTEETQMIRNQALPPVDLFHEVPWGEAFQKTAAHYSTTPAQTSNLMRHWYETLKILKSRRPEGQTKSVWWIELPQPQ